MLAFFSRSFLGNYLIILTFALFGLFLFSHSIRAQSTDDKDVITFLNGYQIQGKLVNIDYDYVTFEYANGVKKFNKNSTNYICINNAISKCKIYKPYERMFASIIPGVGQLLGKQYREGTWVMSITLISLIASYFLYVDVTKRQENLKNNINENNEAIQDLNNQLSGLGVPNATNALNRIQLLEETNRDLENQVARRSSEQRGLLLVALGIWAMNLGHAYQNGFTPINKQKKDIETSAISALLPKTKEENLEGSLYFSSSPMPIGNRNLPTTLSTNMFQFNIGYQVGF